MAHQDRVAKPQDVTGARTQARVSTLVGAEVAGIARHKRERRVKELWSKARATTVQVGVTDHIRRERRTRVKRRFTKAIHEVGSDDVSHTYCLS